MPDESQSTTEQIAALQKQVDELKKQISPEQLAKAIDRSYLSVGNLRAFLQILSLIMTVFVGGAVYFSYIGLSGILKIQEQANEIQSMVQSTKKVHSRILALESTMEQTIREATNKTDSQISQLQSKVNTKLKGVDNQITSITSNLHDISTVFNKIAESHTDILNAREEQLLTLIAQEIDPSNPIFHYNLANYDLSFHRYDEALNDINATLSNKGTPSDVIDKARSLKTTILALKANPPKLQYVQVDNNSARVGKFGIIQLPVNILSLLIYNGYITVPQAQKVMDSSQIKTP